MRSIAHDVTLHAQRHASVRNGPCLRLGKEALSHTLVAESLLHDEPLDEHLSPLDEVLVDAQGDPSGDNARRRRYQYGSALVQATKACSDFVNANLVSELRQQLSNSPRVVQAGGTNAYALAGSLRHASAQLRLET